MLGFNRRVCKAIDDSNAALELDSTLEPPLCQPRAHARFSKNTTIRRFADSTRAVRGGFGWEDIDVIRSPAVLLEPPRRLRQAIEDFNEISNAGSQKTLRPIPTGGGLCGKEKGECRRPSPTSANAWRLRPKGTSSIGTPVPMDWRWAEYERLGKISMQFKRTRCEGNRANPGLIPPRRPPNRGLQAASTIFRPTLEPRHSLLRMEWIVAGPRRGEGEPRRPQKSLGVFPRT